MPSLLNLYPYKALTSQYLYLRNLLSSAGFTKLLKNGNESLVTPTYRAYCYIFHQYTQRFKVLRRDEDGWLQLNMDDLNTRFEGWKSRELEQAGLLAMRRQYEVGKYSFRYRIPEDILKGWIAAQDFNSGYSNYFSGKPWSEKDEAELWLELEKAWEGYPSKMREAADSIKESRFNLPAIENHIAKLRVEFSSIALDSPTYEAKAGELLNDELCFSALLAMNPSALDANGFCSFKPRYQPATTGRINMAGGALQSCTREMKLAAYGALEGMNNYDLSSSQARILYCQEFSKYGIECPWLAEYLADKEKRREYAKTLGIPDRVWKTCLSSLLMGAHLPSSANSKNSSILKTLRLELTSDERELQRVLGQLREIVKPLMSALKQWHTKLIEEIQETGFLMNAMGIPIRLENLLTSKPYKKIAAHILQGTEAYFIQELTLLAPKYGYKPIANEHDGLIVAGEIPEEAVEEARRITELDFMALELKNDFGAAH